MSVLHIERLLHFLKLSSHLFILRLNVPVNNFSVMSGWSQRFLGINQYCREFMCLAQGHNTVPHVGIKPRTYRSLRRCSTTMPTRSRKLSSVVVKTGYSVRFNQKPLRQVICLQIRVTYLCYIFHIFLFPFCFISQSCCFNIAVLYEPGIK